MSQYDDPPTFPGYTSLPPGSWDGTTEALAMDVVMEPPEGFLARAVARGLAVVEAEEALVASSPAPDEIPEKPEEKLERDFDRGHPDSGIFLLSLIHI